MVLGMGAASRLITSTLYYNDVHSVVRQVCYTWIVLHCYGNPQDVYLLPDRAWIKSPSVYHKILLHKPKYYSPTPVVDYHPESPLDGIPTGRNPHQNFMYQWVFRTVGIPDT